MVISEYFGRMDLRWLVGFIMLGWTLGPLTATSQNLSNDHFNQYTDELTTRVYSVLKYNSFQFADDSGHIQTYRPNTDLNIGVGVNYRGLGLNISFNTGILEKDNEEYGTTKNLNLNVNIYNLRFAHTAFLEFNEGYYISDDNSTVPPGNNNSLLVRSDLKFTVAGLTSLYFFNHRNLSFRSTFAQDSWQKKSAGSFILGAYVAATNVQGDTSILLQNLDFTNYYQDVIQVNSYDVGPLFGYTFNLVFKKNWFFLIQLTGGAGLNYLSIVDQENVEKKSNNLNLRGQERLGIGYNNEKYQIAITYINETNSVLHNSGNFNYNVGELRLNLVYRFSANLKHIDKVMDHFHWFFLPKAAEENTQE